MLYLADKWVLYPVFAWGGLPDLQVICRWFVGSLGGLWVVLSFATNDKD